MSSFYDNLLSLLICEIKNQNKNFEQITKSQNFFCVFIFRPFSFSCLKETHAITLKLTPSLSNNPLFLDDDINSLGDKVDL